MSVSKALRTEVYHVFGVGPGNEVLTMLGNVIRDDSGNILIADVPTSDPGVDDAIYRTGSDLKISFGN